MRFTRKLPILVAALLAITFVTGCPPVHAQDASPTPTASPSPAVAIPTPVPWAKVSSEAEAAFAELGEVRRIGIRACVIRTADGSEIIVPNGSLISNQVTNWTFSDRTRAIEVPVNILPGTDSQRVVNLLKSVAANQPGIAKEPAPQVYVVTFTAGAITFQLRAWTDRYQDWAQVRSDLAVAISDALAGEKIGIA